MSIPSLEILILSTSEFTARDFIRILGNRGLDASLSECSLFTIPERPQELLIKVTDSGNTFKITIEQLQELPSGAIGEENKAYAVLGL